MKRCPLWLALVLVGPVAAQTQLRHDNYLAFLAEPGEMVRVVVDSLKHAGYSDSARVVVIDSQSRRMIEDTVTLGTSKTIEVPIKTAGLHVVGIMTGQTLATVTLVDKPFAFVAWRNVALDICRTVKPLYFMVPAGRQQAELHAQADVVGEGATIRVISPAGRVAWEKTDDFDQDTKILVDVAAGEDGQPWSVVVEDPKQPKLGLDDLTLYLGNALPPYLAEDPAWLQALAGRERHQSDKIDWRLPLKVASLHDGQSQTVTFKLDAVPAGKTVALRLTAQDADYETEGSFQINGQGTYKIPITGDGAVDTFTLKLKPGELVAGDNVIEFRHDNRASGALGLSQVELLVGDRIQEYLGW